MGIDRSTYLLRFGENLRRLRKLKKLSQHQLAVNCDADRAKISLIENGKKDFFFTTLVELANGLDVDPRELMDFDRTK